MQDLSQSQWRDQISQDENAIILDVRTDMEVAEGIIPSAKQMNIQNAGAFMDSANELDKSKSYYIYCKSGGRSAQACMILDSLGFENTYNLLGGITEWEGETTT